MRVELRDVSKRFGPVTALRGVTLDLPSGSRTALIGPNGAGKSTLTRIVMGMLACEGEVLVDGRSPFRDRATLAHRLAYVPQVAPQLGATVGELVRTVARLRDIPVERFAATARELVLDIESVRRRPLRGLSGGMRQKLLLALALTTEASLLILDEPTASLDVQSRQRFFELVAELPNAPSIMLCSHRLEEISNLVDRVLVLEDGRVVHDGDADLWARQLRNGQRTEVLSEVLTPGAYPMKWIQNLPVLLAIVVLASGLAFVAVNVLASTALPDGPAEIVWDREVCAHCRMHVGEPAFATQLQTADGQVLSFDDPGCAALLLREKAVDVHALYFRHHVEDRWIPVEGAAFVAVAQTPMGFGYGAVDAGTDGAIPWSDASDRMARRN